MAQWLPKPASRWWPRMKMPLSGTRSPIKAERECGIGPCAMPVDTTHPDYDGTLPARERARHVLAGEDAVKAAGIRYLPRLDAQSDEDYKTYKDRAALPPRALSMHSWVWCSERK
jgi:hypothetical protein